MKTESSTPCEPTRLPDAPQGSEHKDLKTVVASSADSAGPDTRAGGGVSTMWRNIADEWRKSADNWAEMASEHSRKGEVNSWFFCLQNAAQRGDWAREADENAKRMESL